MTDREQMNAQGRTLLRLVQELREWLQPISEPEAQSLLTDLDVVERVGRWLAHAVPIQSTTGIPSAGSAARPSMGTARPLDRL